MPAITEDVLDTVVYLYPDAASAAAGERAGGLGSVVVIPGPHEPFVGGVGSIGTNSHGVMEGTAPSSRANTRDERVGIISSTTPGAIPYAYGKNIASLTTPLDSEESNHKPMKTAFSVTKEKLQEYKIGPGDEVFIAGRFVSHE